MTIDSIPTGRPVSVERETFPGLLGSGARVGGIVDRGYWLDLGTPLSFVQGSRDLVLGAIAVGGFAAAVLGGLTVYPALWVLWLSLQYRVPVFSISRWAGLEHYAFLAVDHGQVGGSSAAQLAGRRLTGMALGVRGSAWRTQWELFVGGPLHKPAAFRAARAIGGFQLVWSY